MKKNNLNRVVKRVVAGCLAMAMILTGILVMPKETEAAETTDAKAVYFDTEKEYTMSDYWSESGQKAPVKEGYVFGGWFKAGTQGETGAEQSGGSYYVPLKQAELTAAETNAVAKFVPAEVLSIKTQVGTSTQDNKEITSMRILSTVDSTNYQEVGFEYKLATKDTAWTQNIKKVYSAIKPYKGASESEMQTPGGTFVKDISKYFIAADVNSIADTSFSKIVYARPFWITMDGTKVTGLARNSRVEDKDKDKDYTSVGINLLPQLSEGKIAEVAAGRIQVTYNQNAYEVVGTPDITTDNTNGGTYLFPEMECHVDETNGTITFVGNADTVNTNLTADGLFANVRFQKKTDADSNATLNFKVKAEATDFCNWAEDEVNAVVVQ